MFTPVPMRQVNVFVEKEDIEQAVISLARYEAFHLSPPPEGPGETQEMPVWSELADRYNAQQQRIDTLLDTLQVQRSRMPAPQRLSPGADAGDIADAIEEAETAVRDWRDRRQETESEIRHFEYLVKEMQLFEPLKIPVEEIRKPAYMHWVVGTMPRENIESLRLALFENTESAKRMSGKRRINIFLPASEVEQATLALLKSGNFQPIKATGEEWPEKSSEWKTLSNTYTGLVQRIEALMDAVDVARPEVPLSEKAAPETEADEISKKTELQEKSIQEWQDRKVEQEERIRQLEAQIRTVRLFEPADIQISSYQSGYGLYWIFCTMPKTQLDSIKILTSGIPAVFIPFVSADDRAVVAGVTVREHARLFDALIGILDIKPLHLPVETSGTPSEMIEKLSRRLEENRRRLADIEDERRHSITEWRQQLFSLWRRATTNARIAGAISDFARLGDIILISGQVPSNAIDDVLLTVENATGGRAEIEVLDSSRERDLPVEVMLFRIPFVVLPVALTDKGDRLLVVAATAEKYADILEGAVRGVFMEPVTLPKDVTGTPAEILTDLQQRLADRRSRLQHLETERQQLARQWGRRLMTFRQVVSADLQVAGAITRFTRHQDVFLISGWIPEAEVDGLVDRMETTTEGRTDIEVLEPKPGGRRLPPTMMRNPRFLRPFEAIVGTFGTPGYHEIDPTPLAALTYTLMYGMMFGDVGHGLILAIFGGYLVSRSGRGTMAHALGAIFAASGVCAMIFGTFYGSLFGREDILPGLWLSPMEDIMDLMRYSIAGGVVLLTIGFLAAIANAIRTKNWGTLLFGHSGIAGFWFYWAIIGGGYAVIQGMLPMWIEVVLLAVPAVLLLFHEPLGRLVNGKTPIGPLLPAESPFELFDAVIRNFTNTLSFVRLGAFAIAHAGLMHIVFMLAERSGGIFAWIIIVFGTLLVIGFEGLVVAIQSLRLEYYEFFSKFLDGRGDAFKPFRLMKAE